jgi:dCMP deaminase
MRYATDSQEIEEIRKYMKIAAKEALKSPCIKSKRGAVIVKDNRIIAMACNEPLIPELCDPCIREDIKDNSRVELCSAIHAEQLAILNACNNGESLSGSRMYHIKVKNGEMQASDDLSCTVCSRIIYKSGISEFVLMHSDGFCIYEPDEYNRLSFDYFLGNK